MPYPHSITIDSKQAVVHTQCIYCNKTQDITLDIDRYVKWQTGKSIQLTFPELDPNTRELLISSTCSECNVTYY